MNEDDFVDFKCPYCGDMASFPSHYIGQTQECPNCAESLIVPQAGSSAGGRIPLPVRTDRLILRRLRGADWKDLTEILGDEDLYCYLEGRPLGEEEITRWLEADSQVRLTTAMANPEQAFCLALELAAQQKVIGFVSLSIDHHRRQATPVLIVGRAYQRQGLASEALRATLQFCLRGIGLRRVAAYCDGRNVAARRLFEKAGLRREGEFIKDRFLNDEWVNTVWYALLQEEAQPS